MSRICFVTDEIHPVKPGGAGSLIFALAQALLAEGHEVVFVFDIPRPAFERFEKEARCSLPNSDKCRTYHVETLCTGIPHQRSDFLSRYTWESYRCDYACRQVYEIEKPDLIEFSDYCGPAFMALSAKIANLSYQDTHLAVRMHGPIELIDQAARVRPIDFDRYTIYAIENQSFRLAETVLYANQNLLPAVSDKQYEPWFGETVLSPPIISEFPSRGEIDPRANIALFYGRLYAQKGVDRFVEAAIGFLIDHPNSQLEFFLTGSDSKEPPDPRFNSYRQYLLEKIPLALRSRFTFTGFFTRAELESLLPRVKFAVLPSYYETYCFAAHELRLAGIPLIVSDIPAFRDNLRPGVDALFFDGSIGDLIQKIHHLDDDNALREKLSTPLLPDREAGLVFYRSIPNTGWLSTPQPPTPTNLVVCVVDDSPEESNAPQTIETVRAASPTLKNIVWLKRSPTGSAGGVRFLGSTYNFFDHSGSPILSTQALTSDAILLLRSGDRLDPDYIPRCLDILSRRPQAGYVGSWKWIGSGRRMRLQTHPFPAMLELAPFETESPLHRCVMRTRAGQLLIDLFDPRAESFGELAYLWKLEDTQTFGLQIPAPLIWQHAEPIGARRSSERSYLLLHDSSPTRNRRLSRYLGMLANGYPQPLLPLQAAWARRYHLRLSLDKKMPVFSGTGFRSRLLDLLNRSGPMGRSVLAIIAWLREKTF